MALPTSHNKILQQHRQEIVSTVNPNTLLPILLTKKLVTEEEFREITEDSGRATDGQRNGKLLDIVAKKGADAFDLFISALKEEEKHLGHESLAKTLEEEKAKLPKPLSRGHKRQEVDPAKFTLILEDALNRQQQGSNLELAALTSMQASLQQLITRVGTIETDLRDVKDVTKDIKHAEQIHETRMSFSMQSIYEKLEYILSTTLTDAFPKMTEQEEYLEHGSVISQVNKPMQETEIRNENSYITAASHHKELKNTSLQQTRSSDATEYAEPYEIFSFSNNKRAQSLDSLNTISGKSSRSSLYTDSSSSIDPAFKMPCYANLTHAAVGNPRVCQRKLMPKQAFKYQHMEINMAIYKPKQKIGEGKSGEFWEAVNTTDSSIVVIKYSKIKDKFKLKEIAALTRISHPNVIKLVGISTVRTPMALIMEYIDNGNLLSFLRSNKNSIKTLQQLALAESIARGMMELEHSNIVHCDLTAHSILIDTHLVCKISSFNNALCLDSTSGSVILPETVELLLPLKWCAPEVFLDRKFSTKSDVWSFSVILYEIFSMGAPPYSGMSNSEVRGFVTKGAIMPKPSSFSSTIYELMQSCFKFTPVDRPAFTHIYKTLKSLHDKKRGGSTREYNTADDYGTI